MATLRHGTIPHLPALDGLRGLAVVGVLLFHANGTLRGGYLGVDLFFVLSGYLITSILLAEHEQTGRIDLGRFWIRRARRLMPALFSLMPAVAIYGFSFAKADELAALRMDALAALAYVANWRAVFTNKSYWELFTAPSPLEHTWSLAIEEQFYVLWPLVCVLVLSVWRGSRRALFWLSGGLALLSMLAMAWLFDGEHTARAYLGTDTRAAAILLGAAFAACFPPGVRVSDRALRWLDGLGFVAALGLGLAWFTLEGESPLLYRGGFWLTELGCLALIACAVVGERSVLARLLAARPLAFFGAISYGLYLWHWPINCVLTPERLRTSWPLVHALRAALTLAIALLSYRYYEQPIRKRGLYFGKPWFVIPASLGGCLALLFAATEPRPALAEPSALPNVSAAAASSPGPSVFSVPFRDLPPKASLRPATPRLLVLGDSVASKLGAALRYRQDEFGVFVAERGVGNCSILDDPAGPPMRSNPSHEGYTCSADWRADVQALTPDATLLVLGGGYYAKVPVAGNWVRACEPGWAAGYEQRLNELLAQLGADAGRVIIAIVPYPVGKWRSPGLLERVDCFNASLRAVAARNALPTIDLMSHVCPTRDCELSSDGEAIRPDGLHFDGRGAEASARFVLHEVARRAPLALAPAPP